MLSEQIAILERTPGALTALLRGLPRALVATKIEGPDTWSAIEVVAHLISADETAWLPRLRTILEHGASAPFPPPRQLLPPERIAGRDIESLLEEFSTARGGNVAVVRDLEESQLDLEGMHPHYGRVTLRELVSTWSVHDLNHQSQICRVVAKCFADRTGNWRGSLPILER